MLRLDGVEYQTEQYKELAELLVKRHQEDPYWTDRMQFGAYIDQLKMLEQWLIARGDATENFCFCGNCYRCKKGELMAELVELERKGESTKNVKQKLRGLKAARLLPKEVKNV